MKLIVSRSMVGRRMSLQHFNKTLPHNRNISGNG
jgi:hypothetical protein